MLLAEVAHEKFFDRKRKNWSLVKWLVSFSWFEQKHDGLAVGSSQVQATSTFSSQLHTNKKLRFVTRVDKNGDV